MVRAELSYNPYLLETEVRFNGDPPRINSLVEKYQKTKLQTWVSDLPGIFYDEMNGYDFELDFSGTELDFEELKKSFVQAGVGKDLVQLFHKGKLGSRQEKTRALEDFLKWLQENPNRKFNLSEFQMENKEVYEGAYPFVIIGGLAAEGRLFEDIDVSVENVVSADELRKTDLRSTPILLYLDRKSLSSLQGNLLKLLKRSDVSQDQLFFMISPVLGDKVVRVIKDLGVKNPQIVSSPDDTKIYRYLEVFPVSEYIHAAVTILQIQASAQESILEAENRESEITNHDIHEKIRCLDDILSRLKTAADLFTGKDNLETPLEFVSAQSDLLASINRWRVRKTKITKIEEAELLSREFDNEIQQQFNAFQKMINYAYSMKCATLVSQCEEWYQSAHYKEDFETDSVSAGTLSVYSVPGIADNLLEIKDEQYVMPREDFLGNFGKLFKTTQDEVPQEPVLETTYYLEKWREHASEMIVPITDSIIQEAFTCLQDYYQRLSDLFIHHIELLTEEVTAEKEKTSSQLSEDEKFLQADNDWYIDFCDRLRAIERS